ncbi:MAG: hypothetical protein GY816_14675 [Cytophagales bacterium]|nr:hypothetical protein [Cytophagales bacterium]
MVNLSQVNISGYNDAETLIHRLAQFPAIVGKNLVSQETDDSNTTLNWNSAAERLESQLINEEYQLSIHISNFSLQWSKGDEILSEFVAEKKSKDEIFNWLTEQVENAGLEASKLHYIDHYEVPEHPVDKGGIFVKPSDEILRAWMNHRTMANELMAELNGVVGINSAIRVWPHHFDTGTYYPFGEKKAIGAGWAIGDSMSEYPYLYIYPWDADNTLDLSYAPELKLGTWLNDDWVGAIFPLNEMIDRANLEEDISSLIKSVSLVLKDKLNV